MSGTQRISPMDSGVCKRCGVQLPHGARFCKACGESVTGGAGAAPSAGGAASAGGVGGTRRLDDDMFDDAPGRGHANPGRRSRGGGSTVSISGTSTTSDVSNSGSGRGDVRSGGARGGDARGGGGGRSGGARPDDARGDGARADANDDETVRSMLVILTPAEAYSGCVKRIVVDKSTRRTIEVNIPAGITIETKLDVPGFGYPSSATGRRGPLRLSFFID
ncbi:MAG: hypothetical protein IKG18_04265 [Atopobiaceae bacterium]|nr:hypothetical protein [Atopobiaceae bacterium]